MMAIFDAHYACTIPEDVSICDREHIDHILVALDPPPSKSVVFEGADSLVVSAEVLSAIAATARASDLVANS